MPIDISNVDDLRRVYLYIFDAFAASNTEISGANKGINTRYARELAATLQNGGLVYLTEDGEGSDAWQAVDTHDSITRDEAEAKFNEWAQVKPPTPGSATPTSKPGKSATREPHDCLCGCGEVITTKALYKPGHDARHAGVVGREIAANYGTKGFDRRELLATLGSDKLRDKAGRVAENATKPKASRSKPDPEPVHVDGTAKVGKTEVVARKWPTANGKDEQYEYLHPTKGEWTVLSKTASKTFQEG